MGFPQNLSLALADALLAVAAAASAAGAQERPAKPNIVLMVSDDFGYGDAGIYGGGPGRGMSARQSWFYFAENELTPGEVRWHNCKFVFNLRGDDGAPTGGLAVDSNLGWKGPDKYVATVPQVFDLWQDPQERYDIFMNNFTERTWVSVVVNEATNRLMKTYVAYPPRKPQSLSYTGRLRFRTIKVSSGFASSSRRKASTFRYRREIRRLMAVPPPPAMELHPCGPAGYLLVGPPGQGRPSQRETDATRFRGLQCAVELSSFFFRSQHWSMSSPWR